MTVVPTLPALTLRGASIAPVTLALKKMDSLAQVRDSDNFITSVYCIAITRY